MVPPARAWTLAATWSEGAERRDALARAASLALAARDEVAVLVLERMAREHGEEDALRPHAVEARRRLGLAALVIASG